MSEYTLKRDITSYTYPPHIKKPSNFYGTNFFERWIPNWKSKLSHLINKPNVTGIEIGALYGDCAIFCAENIVNGTDSIHYCIDIDDNEYLLNNISPYKNIKLLKGYSEEVLRNYFTQPKVADYIYIDGSHLAMDVLQDSVLSWYLLKDNGILIWDDYEWGIHTTDEKQKPKLGIDCFLNGYKGYYNVIQLQWQVFIEKLPSKIIYNKETEQIERVICQS
jgi:hypothetical protein